MDEEQLFRGYGVTAQARPYVRVYYSIMDDPKFAGLGDRALGCWLRLLVVADAMYPAPAYLPRKVNAADVKKLADVGLVDVMADDQYRIHGLAKERETRSDWGRSGANARWSQSDRNATALPPQSDRNAKPMLSEPLLSEPNRSTPANGKAIEEKTWVELTDDEKAQRRQRDKNDLIARMEAKLGVRP